MKLFDAHCHLQDERLLPRIDAVMERARLAGVRKLCCCGSSEADWGQVRELAARYGEVVPAFGLHPWYVGSHRANVASQDEKIVPGSHRACPGGAENVESRTDPSSNWQNALLDFLKACPGAGVGEIGLDHAIKDGDANGQAGVFLAQLRIAKELKRPVSIHCRRAWDVMPELLKSVGVLPAGFVIHSYSGSPELIEQLAKLGAYFSFSGSITFSGNRKGHRSAQAVPPDRLLIETDAPDLAPTQARSANEPNEPANIVHVLGTLAELRGMSGDELAERTWDNAERIFYHGVHGDTEKTETMISSVPP